jgi:hypothetical protein
MAERRMFAKTIIDSDAFLEMPLSTQALYFHLSMRADDDGFINNPKKIQRMVGASEDEMKVLITKKFIIPFESGIVVIKHWKIHNYIQKDRYKETVYTKEKSMLSIKDNGVYTEMDTNCIPNVSKMETQVSIGKYSIVKDSIVEDNIYPSSDTSNDKHKEVKHKYGEFNNVLLTDDEYIKVQELPCYEKLINSLSIYIASKGNKYKSHYHTLLSWSRRNNESNENSTFDADDFFEAALKRSYEGED